MAEVVWIGKKWLTRRKLNISILSKKNIIEDPSKKNSFCKRIFLDSCKKIRDLQLYFRNTIFVEEGEFHLLVALINETFKAILRKELIERYERDNTKELSDFELDELRTKSYRMAISFIIKDIKYKNISKFLKLNSKRLIKFIEERNIGLTENEYNNEKQDKAHKKCLDCLQQVFESKINCVWNMRESFEKANAFVLKCLPAVDESTTNCQILMLCNSAFLFA